MIASATGSTTLMAEVNISNSTPTQCSPPTKKARMEGTTADSFKSAGSLTFLIQNFREFAKRPPGVFAIASMRPCDAKVSLRGLTFGLAVCAQSNRCVPVKDKTQEGIGIIVECKNASGCNAKGDGSWSCLATVTLRIKSLLNPGADLSYQFTRRFFSNKKSFLEWFDSEPWSFEHLLDPKWGLYNEEKDTLELVAEISVDAPAGIMELPKRNTIQVNGETLFVNKNQLAMHSDYFHSMFYNEKFDEGKSGEYEVKIEAPATVEHFKRMLDTMCPMNKPLDDQCIEGVLHLANQFLVTDVEGKCLEFLTERSTKSALFKYRVADKYGYISLKNHVLNNFKATDFEKELFLANLDEYNQLGSSAAKALRVRYNALIPPKI